MGSRPCCSAAQLPVDTGTTVVRRPESCVPNSLLLLGFLKLWLSCHGQRARIAGTYYAVPSVTPPLCIHIYELPDEEFKITVIKTLNNLKENTYNYAKSRKQCMNKITSAEIETIKNNSNSEVEKYHNGTEKFSRKIPKRTWLGRKKNKKTWTQVITNYQVKGAKS